MHNVLFVGGGSLGHIAPSVAVLEELQGKVNPHFVCSPSTLDTSYLHKLTLPFTTINAPRLGVSFLWKYWKALGEARKILEEHNPDLIFSKGGYVSVPLCAAAKKKNIPIVLHESDAVMGNANKIIAKWATKVTYGNPIRKMLSSGNKEEGKAVTRLHGDKPVLLVIGGSQGAESMNTWVTSHLGELLEQYQIIHLSGVGKTSAQSQEGYYCSEFANDELPHLYALADVALSRAGGNVTAELQENGIPAVLVPLRGVGHDHQQKNAEILAQQDNFTVLQQNELDDKLIPMLQELVSKPPSSSSTNRAAEEIAQIILEVLASTSRGH